MSSADKTSTDLVSAIFRPSSGYLASILACLWIAAISGVRTEARFAAQAEADVSPDAVPQVRRVNPNQAAAGDEIAVTIDGQNFSSGAYVSFSDPSIQVVSTRRASPTQLEAKLVVKKKAQPGAVTLFVSNPASMVAESSFTIVASAVPPAPPISAPEPAKPATEVRPADSGAPVVARVDPSSIGRGGAATLKITGKNFVTGAKVAFSNPDIRVLQTQVVKTTEMIANIQISPDAATGVTNLFVVNPDGREVEASFSVTDAGRTTEMDSTTGVAGTAGSSNTQEQRFDVYNLGDGISILQSPHHAKGTLAIVRGKLTYEEGGKEVFSTSLAEIKEVGGNVVFGLGTGTFHIILTSGKTYNFVASSLRPADTQATVSALQSKLK